MYNINIHNMYLSIQNVRSHAIHSLDPHPMPRDPVRQSRDWVMRFRWGHHSSPFMELDDGKLYRKTMENPIFDGKFTYWFPVKIFPSSNPLNHPIPRVSPLHLPFNPSGSVAGDGDPCLPMRSLRLQAPRFRYHETFPQESLNPRNSDLVYEDLYGFTPILWGFISWIYIWKRILLDLYGFMGCWGLLLRVPSWCDIHRVPCGVVSTWGCFTVFFIGHGPEGSASFQSSPTRLTLTKCFQDVSSNYWTPEISRGTPGQTL